MKKISLTALIVIGVIFLLAVVAVAMISPKAAFTMTMLPMVFGTTLAANSPRNQELGDVNMIPVIASDIIYEGAAVGTVAGTGHARPLTSVDRFVGFALKKADNSAGSAADINVTVQKRGAMQLSITGAVITDIGQPVYATDDNAFAFNPVGAVFVGFVRRFVSSGVVIVEFDADNYTDPYADYVKETISDDKTLDVQDNGKCFFVDTDAKVITLPATTTGLNCKIVNIGAFGTVLVSIDPQNADKIMGPDLAGGDGKKLNNTKATAKRGDCVVLQDGHADGYIVQGLKGTWAAEA